MRGQGRVTFGVVRFVVIDSLTHPLAQYIINYSFTHSLTHSFIVPQLFIHSFIYCPSVTDSLTHSFIVFQLFIHSLTHLLPLSYSFTYSLACSHAYATIINSHICSPASSLTYSIGHIPIRSFTRSHADVLFCICVWTDFMDLAYVGCMCF